MFENIKSWQLTLGKNHTFCGVGGGGDSGGGLD